MSAMSGLPLVFPLYVAASGRAVEAATGDEQEVRQPVEIAPGSLADRLRAPEGHESTLGATAYRACEVRRSGSAAAAWKDELLEGREAGIPALDLRLERYHLAVLEKRMPRNGKLAAQV